MEQNHHRNTGIKSELGIEHNTNCYAVSIHYMSPILLGVLHILISLSLYPWDEVIAIPSVVQMPKQKLIHVARIAGRR